MSRDIIVDEDEIDIKEIFALLRTYKNSILVVLVLFTVIATFYAYFKANVFESQATIVLEKENPWGRQSSDMMSLALRGGNANLDNEQYILTSRALSEKVLRSIEIGTRYYSYHNLRRKELYSGSPFVVETRVIDSALQGAIFELETVDETHFILSIAPAVETKVALLQFFGFIDVPTDKPTAYTQQHTYGEEIVTEWFSLTVNRVFDMPNSTYEFTVVDNSKMAGFIQGGLSSSLVSEMGTILKVTFTDNVALRSQEILNALISRYLDQQLEEKTQEAEQTLKFIDAQIEEINKDVEKSQGKLEKFRSKNTIVDASSQAMLTAQSMSDYESKLQALDIESNVLKNVQTYMNTGKDMAGISLGSAAYTDPALAQMIQKLQESMLQRNAMLVEYTELHPDIVKLTESINAIKSSIKFTLQNDITIINQRKKTLRRYIRKYKKSLEALPENERKLANLTRNTLVNEKVYNFLLEKRAETAILRSSTVSKTRVLDSALLPRTPVKPKRLLIILVGMILGFIVGVAQAFLRDFLDDTIKSSEDIERYSTLPLYGVIPMLTEKTRVQFDEAIRVLRTNLQFVGGQKACKIVALTSSISGEGKSTTALALSKMIAATGKKVILLDLDMRRSKLQETMQQEHNMGMSTYLSGLTPLSEVIQKNVEDNLDMIFVGPKPPNPSELLVSPNFELILEQLQKEYTYIILDTPPIGLVADAMILLKHADVGLVVTRAYFSNRAFLKNIERLVKEQSLDQVGIIVNGLEGKKNGYGYGYGYGYGTEPDYYDK